MMGEKVTELLVGLARRRGSGDRGRVVVAWVLPISIS